MPKWTARYHSFLVRQGWDDFDGKPYDTRTEWREITDD